MVSRIGPSKSMRLPVGPQIELHTVVSTCQMKTFTQGVDQDRAVTLPGATGLTNGIRAIWWRSAARACRTVAGLSRSYQTAISAVIEAWTIWGRLLTVYNLVTNAGVVLVGTNVLRASVRALALTNATGLRLHEPTQLL